MKRKAPLLFGLAMACISVTQTAAADSSYNTSYWTSNDGGIFNVPAVEYNAEFHGYGSSGQVVYNKIDLQTGAPMDIAKNSALFDNQGNLIGTAKLSKIGYYDGKRDGGIIAGATTQLNINGRLKRVAYVWSVNINEGGRKSGWTEIENLSPTGDIEDILTKTKKARYAIFDAERKKGNYVAKTVKGAYLPAEAAEWYVTAGRDASKSAGKAKYYFTRDGLISGLINIPETGRQRYGVAHDVAPIGATFYLDKRVPKKSLDIFPPSSNKPSGYTLDLVWGYFRNNSNRKVYSWLNAQTLR